uniref:HDC02009 n=1 Tax=Drosophila melanogaster TaxID=7227 RepID=Q6IHP6_DROME|nr:TPA_inf: HDC02009 [Drosophila melanogaster]
MSGSTLELWRVVYGKEVDEEWAGGGGAGAVRIGRSTVSSPIPLWQCSKKPMSCHYN